MQIDNAYSESKNQVIKAERRILKELGFCIHFKHPHKVKYFLNIHNIHSFFHKIQLYLIDLIFFLINLNHSLFE
jgi:hypothetical protein